jgi:hypothetical protein
MLIVPEAYDTATNTALTNQPEFNDWVIYKAAIDPTYKGISGHKNPKSPTDYAIESLRYRFLM